MTIIETIKTDIKVRYPEIYLSNNNRFENLTSKLSKTGFWTIFLIYLLLIILVTIYSIFFDFKFLKLLNVNFDDNIKSFSTSVITLVSMNLFVTNLLLTHLKDERDDLQTIIDKRVNFKFITYLGFTIILSILILYFLSSSITDVNVKSNILILIFTTFIFYIFQLVGLYNGVFNFLNKRKRMEIISSELDNEFSKAFYNHFLRMEFKKRYQNLIEMEYKFEKYFSYSHAHLNLNGIYFKPKKSQFLVDVKVNLLKTAFDNINDSQKFYIPLDLDMRFDKLEEKHVLYFSQNPNKSFHKFYILKSKPVLKSEIEDENLKRLLNKISNNTLVNKFTDLQDNLDNLDKIFSKYMNLQKNTNL